MLHALKNDPLVGNAQALQVGVERGVIRIRLISRSDHDADPRALRDALRVARRHLPRAHAAKVVRISAVDPLEKVLGAGLARSGRIRPQVRLKRSGSHQRDRPEQLGKLESESCRAIAAHAEAVDQPALARGDRPIGGVEVRDQLRDDDRLERHRSILPVHIHSEVHAVDEDDETRRQPSGRDRLVDLPRHRLDAGQATAGAVQPIDHRKAARSVGVIRRRDVEVVADEAAHRGALERLLRDPRRRDRARHPLDAHVHAGGGGQRGHTRRAHDDQQPAEVTVKSHHKVPNQRSTMAVPG